MLVHLQQCPGPPAPMRHHYKYTVLHVYIYYIYTYICRKYILPNSIGEHEAAASLEKRRRWRGRKRRAEPASWEEEEEEDRRQKLCPLRPQNPHLGPPYLGPPYVALLCILEEKGVLLSFLRDVSVFVLLY